MSGWELFTWLNVAVLGIGSVVVFVLFLGQIGDLLPPRREPREDSDGE